MNAPSVSAMPTAGSDTASDGCAPVAPPWWHERSHLHRVVADLVLGEMRRLRPGASLAPPDALSPELEISPGGLAADSLELLTLATALTEMLHLHRSGIEDYLLARRRLGDWVEIAAAGLERFDAELTFRTSGSTGAPKSCSHPLDRLEEEVAALADLLGPVRRVVALVPAHHIYGFLFTILLPRWLGVPVVDGRGRMPSAVARGLAEGDLLVAVPESWTAIARSGVRLAHGTLGVSSTAPLADESFRSLLAAGLGRLVEVYGSSETAGIGWRDGVEADYRLFPWWQIDGPDGGLHHRRTQASYPLADRLDLREGADGMRFRVLGRRDHAVQVGGINVHPGTIALRLRDVPGLAEIVIRPFAVEGGVRLKAFVVPAAGQDRGDLRERLERAAAERLMPAERPRSWTFGPELPRDPLGKPADWVVAEVEEGEADAAASTTRPSP